MQVTTFTNVTQLNHEKIMIYSGVEKKFWNLFSEKKDLCFGSLF